MSTETQRQKMSPVLSRQEIRDLAGRWDIKLTPQIYRQLHTSILRKEVRSYLGLKARGFFGKSKVLQYYNYSFHESAFAFNPLTDHTYMNSEYWKIGLQPGEKLYRMLSEDSMLTGQIGTWWARDAGRPHSQAQAMIDGAIFSEWNSFTVLAELTVPKVSAEGIIGFEGEVAPQFIAQRNPNKDDAARKYGSIYIGGGNQIFLGRDQQKIILETLLKGGRKFAKKHLRFYLWDRTGENGRMLPLDYDMVAGGFRIDAQTIKNNQRLLWGQLKRMAQSEDYEGCLLGEDLK